MAELPVKPADHLTVAAAHVREVATRLDAGELAGAELHEFGDLLTALAETVHLYADKLTGSPHEGGPPT
ncbi:hypothetical protein [Amycolatopsis tolypomycina]|uniref:hypothetical protein n=1 Tax=Amycolatopsis tolypomycina TaxID=208445 RepID=UPI0033B294BA